MRQIFHDEERPRGAGSFHDLMLWRVRRVLLVSSLYDSFMLAEDRLHEELAAGELLGVELSSVPEVRRVASGEEALELAGRPPGYDLVISSPVVGDMDAGTLARRLRKAGVESPLILLAYHDRELRDFFVRYDERGIDRAFLFQGDIQLFLAIVKYVEDRMNVQHDVDLMGVQVILVIEDNIRYYSSFLPVIYTVVLQNTASLVPEGVNLAHKLLRVKARPKILLASSYEEAWEFFETFEANILGVISDVEFPQGGELRPDAGFRFAREVLRRQPDVPVVLNSGRTENERLAREAGVSFLHKYSPTLLQELRQFMLENFGFGDFVFRLPDGTEVARARDLRELERMLHHVPAESLLYHAARNHFSTWLKAHTEFAVAHRLRPRRLEDFDSAEELRSFLIESIRGHRRQRRRAALVDFEPERFEPTSGMFKVGGGSLGGKARGLAFAARLLRDYDMEDRFAGVRVAVPTTVVIGTDVFDEFLEENDLRDLAITTEEDADLHRAFRAAEFPVAVREELRAYLERVHYPLAVRSSSLLEDAKYQPFAGVYDTVMIPNDHRDPEVRLRHLLQAIQRVYASTFSTRAKRFIASTSYRLEAEKMAVVLQQIVGARHEDRFYPEIAGVALSQNFYPVPPVRPEDGLAAVALGLGAEVVGGERCLHFSPRHPERLLQMSSVKDALRYSQREFYALRLGSVDGEGSAYEARLGRYELSVAERDGTLRWVGSTYSPENDALYDGVSRPGVRLVTFAPVLKHGAFPLAPILSELLEIGAEAAAGPVEMEFAVNLSTPAGEPREFGFLQLRPVVSLQEVGRVKLGEYAPGAVLCHSRRVLGSGRLDTLRDVILVDRDEFDRSRSAWVAEQVARLNGRLQRASVPYVLIGVGRWGSSDPHLGIPVGWEQIAGAKVIVEAGFRDVAVTPSQGTHFFQNLVANNVGYFTVNPDLGDGRLDWEWLRAQPAAARLDSVRHLRFERPLEVLMDGQRNEGVILKPVGG